MYGRTYVRMYVCMYVYTHTHTHYLSIDMQNTDSSMLNNVLMLVCASVRVDANSYAKETLFGDAHTVMHTHAFTQTV
jgi:hypothetical protein